MGTDPLRVSGWCRRCGQPFEDANTPTCECAGDPPLVGAHVPGVEHLHYRNRVRSLRFCPTSSSDETTGAPDA